MYLNANNKESENYVLKRFGISYTKVLSPHDILIQDPLEKTLTHNKIGSRIDAILITFKGKLFSNLLKLIIQNLRNIK